MNKTQLKTLLGPRVSATVGRPLAVYTDEGFSQQWKGICYVTVMTSYRLYVLQHLCSVP